MTPLLRWQTVDPWAGWTLHASPAFDQRSYRFRNDDGNETAATWKANQNTSISQNADTVFRLRIETQETGGAAANNQTIVLQYNIGGGWVTATTSTAVRLAASAHVANGVATTNQLTAGTGTFVAGVMQTTANGSDTSFAANGHTEHEWGLVIDSALVANDTVITFRNTINGNVPNTTTATPTLTAVVAEAYSANVQFPVFNSIEFTYTKDMDEGPAPSEWTSWVTFAVDDQLGGAQPSEWTSYVEFSIDQGYFLSEWSEWYEPEDLGAVAFVQFEAVAVIAAVSAKSVTQQSAYTANSSVQFSASINKQQSLVFAHTAVIVVASTSDKQHSVVFPQSANLQFAGEKQVQAVVAYIAVQSLDAVAQKSVTQSVAFGLVNQIVINTAVAVTTTVAYAAAADISTAVTKQTSSSAVINTVGEILVATSTADSVSAFVEFDHTTDVQVQAAKQVVAQAVINLANSIEVSYATEEAVSASVAFDHTTAIFAQAAKQVSAVLSLSHTTDVQVQAAKQVVGQATLAGEIGFVASTTSDIAVAVAMSHTTAIEVQAVKSVLVSAAIDTVNAILIATSSSEAASGFAVFEHTMAIEVVGAKQVAAQAVINQTNEIVVTTSTAESVSVSVAFAHTNAIEVMVQKSTPAVIVLSPVIEIVVNGNVSAMWVFDAMLSATGSSLTDVVLAGEAYRYNIRSIFTTAEAGLPPATFVVFRVDTTTHDLFWSEAEDAVRYDIERQIWNVYD